MLLPDAVAEPLCTDLYVQIRPRTYKTTGWGSIQQRPTLLGRDSRSRFTTLMWKPVSHLSRYITVDCEALQRVSIRSLGPWNCTSVIERRRELPWQRAVPGQRSNQLNYVPTSLCA